MVYIQTLHWLPGLGAESLDFEPSPRACITFPRFCAASVYFIALAVTVSDATATADIVRATEADSGSNCGLKHIFAVTRSWRSMGMDQRSIQRNNTSDSATETIRDTHSKDWCSIATRAHDSRVLALEHAMPYIHVASYSRVGAFALLARR